MAEKIQKASIGRVCVIGGCGFLGHHIVNVALRDWAPSAVSVIDLRCVRNRRPDSDGVTYIETDITDSAALLKAFQQLKPDVVIHTASPATHATSSVTDAVLKKVNVDGTRTVIEVSQKTGVKAIVYTSSASILSNNVDDLINANEDYPVIRGKEQSEYYTETKAAAEELILAANRAEAAPKLLTTAIRPAGIFGEGDVQVVYHMLNLWREGRHKVQVGDNTNMFDFTYAENVAHAHILAARALLVTYDAKTMPLDHEKVDGEAFIVTNGNPVYFWDFPRGLWSYAGCKDGLKGVWTLPKDVGLVLGFLTEAVFAVIRKPPTLTRQRIVYSCMTRYYDITKIRTRLGYEPIVAFHEGMRRAVQWSVENSAKIAAETKKH